MQIVNSALRRIPEPGELPVNILIVDDEPRNLTVLETILDDPGYNLVRATSGEQALLELVALEFAVLVLDVGMPGMTGFELARMVKDRRKTAHVPIIFLTAYYNDDQHIQEGYDHGAVDYLQKPVNPAVLRSKVAVFATMHRNGRALEVANSMLQKEVSDRRRAEARLNDLTQSLDRQVSERTHALEASSALLREADQRKDEFLATLAHELRNPLAPVRNAVQILKMKGFSSLESEWAAGLISRQVDVMSRLIDDLMDISRINHGRIQLQMERLELAEVLNDAVETSRPLINELGHQVEVTLPGHKVFMNGDRTRLSQAFMNLLNNAAKYTDPGGRIEISGFLADNEVVLRVRDNGIGIPPEQLASVFQMFSQIDTSMSRSRGGLGIGLSLTQRLIEMHGGSVQAHSEGPGQGSEFTVRLPLPIEDAGKEEAPVLAASAPPSALPAALRILIADDNRDAATTMAMVLEIVGSTVRQVQDGEAAVAAAAEFQPHIALLDIGMPGMNGYEACRKIRGQAGGEWMKIIAVTGWNQPEDRLASREAGFDHHLVKPVDPGALINLIAELGVTILTADGEAQTTGDTPTG